MNNQRCQAYPLVSLCKLNWNLLYLKVFCVAGRVPSTYTKLLASTAAGSSILFQSTYELVLECSSFPVKDRWLDFSSNDTLREHNTTQWDRWFLSLFSLLPNNLFLQVCYPMPSRVNATAHCEQLHLVVGSWGSKAYSWISSSVKTNSHSERLGVDKEWLRVGRGCQVFLGREEFGGAGGRS